MTSSKRYLPLSHRRIALALFALFAGIYLLTTGGHTSSIDEELLFGITENLVVWGSFALNAARPDADPVYSYYAPGQPMLAIPLYLLGRGVASFFPPDAYPWVTRVITLWFNPLITAGSAALLYLAVVFLGYRRAVAIGTAVLYGFATFAWEYSKTFFAEPATAFFLFASFVVALYEQRHQDTEAHNEARQGDAGVSKHHRRGLKLLFVSGMLAALALPIKIHGGLAFPFLGLYAALGGARRPFVSFATLARFLAWGLGVGAVFVFQAWYQWSLYDNPFLPGYGTGVLSHFNPKYFWYRLSGLVWSSGRGMIWYAPPLLLLPVGLWLLWRRDWRASLLCIAVTIAHLAFYANLLYWHGGGSWGPRYLVIALPFMVLPLAAFLDTLRGWHTPVRMAALLLTLLLALPVQLGGVAIANEAFFSTRRNVHRDHFDPFDSAIAGHLGLALDRAGQYYDVLLAPDSVSLLSGFSYSEGDRDEGEQLPRWSHPEATIALRHPDVPTLWMTLGLDGCRPPPLPPAQVTLHTDERWLLADTPCPPRTYHLLLPPQSRRLVLRSPPWNPSSVGIERDETLGVQVYRLSASAGGQSLALQAHLIPPTPMPTGYVSIRRWVGDHRMPHWDFWWWYIRFSDLPRVPLGVLAGVWFAVAFGLIGWGGWQLRKSGNVSYQ
jgi:hypothetical protein